MNKKIVVAALGLFVGIGIAHADFVVSDWKFSKDITLPTLSGSTYVTAKIDKDILGESNRLNDLRIITQSGKEIGYQLVTKNAEVQSNFYPSTILNQSTQGGQTTFTIDLGASGVIHDEIEIITSSQNFKRQVSIYAGDALLTNTGYIYNYSDAHAGFNAGNTHVHYPKSTARYIKVVIQNGEGSVLVSGAHIYRYDVSAASEDSYQAKITETENTQNKTSELTFDLGQTGIPTHTMTLETSSENFNRRVVVQGSDDAANWNSLGQGYIFSINTTLFKGRELSVNYPETYYQYLRVIVYNEDNAALHFGTSATVLGTTRNIVFEADPKESYSLYYGNPRANAPSYDISRFFQYIESAALPVATLGSAVENPAYKAPVLPLAPFSERYPYILNMALVILVLALGTMIFVYLKKVVQIQKSQETNINSSDPNKPPYS